MEEGVCKSRSRRGAFAKSAKLNVLDSGGE